MARLAAVLIGPGLVDRLADDVHDAAERLVADRHGDRLAGVGHVLAADQALGAVHGDRAHGALAQVLRDLEHQALALVRGFQRVQDLGQVAVELHVDDGAHHLADLADLVRSHCSVVLVHAELAKTQSASAPEMISISSLVMLAWRWRLYRIVSLLIMSPALRVALSIADHARALLAGRVLEQAAEDLGGDVAGQQVAQDFLLARLVLVDALRPGRPSPLRLRHAGRDELQRGRLLRDDRLELGEVDRGDIELAGLEHGQHLAGDVLGVREGQLLDALEVDAVDDLLAEIAPQVVVALAADGHDLDRLAVLQQAQRIRAGEARRCWY